MKLLRSLLMPVYPTSLFFAALMAALFALVASVETAGVFRIFPIALLLSWLFKYAYAMLEQAADGISEPPIPSVDMLGPFEYRPLMQLGICILVYGISSHISGVPKQLFLVSSLALLPASIGTLGVTGRLLDALNPLMLWRVVKGLGHYYLIVVGVIVCYIAVSVSLAQFNIWKFVWYATSELLLLSAYVLIGSVIYERRSHLNHEPRSSPERQQAKQDQEYNRRRTQMLDEVFCPIRGGNMQNAIGSLNQWLLSATSDRLQQDVSVIMASAVKWNSERGLAVATRGVVSALIHKKRLDVAVRALDMAMSYQPMLVIDSEEDTVTLATYARSIGRRKLALALIRNLEKHDLARPLNKALVELLRELES